MKVSLRVEFGETQRIPLSAEVEVEKGSTVLNLLESQIPVGVKDFPSLGKYVTSIDGIGEDESHHWLFWVNGEFAQVGAGSCILREGDEVLWRLAP